MNGGDIGGKRIRAPGERQVIRTSVNSATVTMVKVLAMEDKPLLAAAMARLPLVNLARQQWLLLLKHIKYYNYYARYYSHPQVMQQWSR
ncbi:hypothetical protein GCK32_017982 [Trichostrongylus colubriformis]|uniref:Uncharacterized protein n=1 Tax=Trichostrongylus colubriformis TaxID=6319 RepID=A0AAN8EVP9_TRICO